MQCHSKHLTLWMKNNCLIIVKTSAFQKIFTEKKLQKQLAVAIDLISLHGAMSRKVASGKSEEVFLSYPTEFLTSEYSFNLEFFANNVRIKKGKFIT